MHDVLDPRDIVLDELEQLASSGHDVADFEERARRAVAADDVAALEAIEMEAAGRAPRPDWPYAERLDDEELFEMWAAVTPMRIDPSDLADRIRGAWLGRVIGNTMGKPVEGLSRAQVGAYLRAAGQWPMRGYLPLLDPLPTGVPHLHPSASTATAGHFDDMPRDDDIDWTMLNLLVLERHGMEITTEQILAEWLDRVPFTQTYTAERAAYRNAIAGLLPPHTATYRNPYREWIGALIRADVFGYVHAGDPAAAARLALVDARLSHVSNGVFGEVWAAALVAAALATESAETALRSARAVVPHQSRLAEALDAVFELFARRVEVSDAFDWVDESLGHYSWVHTLNNAAVVAVALLWGRSFTDAVAIAVSAGRDTDSTAATVGSVYGALRGEGAIPSELMGTAPVRVRSAIRDFDRITIDELAERTLRLRRQAAGRR